MISAREARQLGVLNHDLLADAACRDPLLLDQVVKRPNADRELLGCGLPVVQEASGGHFHWNSRSGLFTNRQPFTCAIR
jgi:hypothetical protein